MSKKEYERLILMTLSRLDLIGGVESGNLTLNTSGMTIAAKPKRSVRSFLTGH